MITEEQVPRSTLEAIDWAVIALLERVRSQVLLPKQQKWLQWLDLPFERRRKWTANLVSAFLSSDSIHAGIPEEYRACLTKFYSDSAMNDDVHVCLKDLLSNNFNWLFNSYYYIKFDAYGVPSLVPVIPGWNSSGRSNFHKITKFLRNAALPFHLDARYLGSYASIVLPLRGGITPKLCKDYEEGRGRSESVISIPVFLGDLNILQKREDYVQRHLSALAGVLTTRDSDEQDEQIGAGYVVGGFVLTCVVPDAFSQMDRQRFAFVLGNSWSFAPIRQLHSGGERLASDIRTSIHWEESSDIKKDEVGEDAIRADTESLLASYLNRGALAVRFSYRDEGSVPCTGTAVSLEAVRRSIHSMFPSGPSVEPRLVCKIVDGITDDEFIDCDLLTELCEQINKLSRSSGVEIERNSSQSQFFGRLPGLGDLLFSPRSSGEGASLLRYEIGRRYTLLLGKAPGAVNITDQESEVLSLLAQKISTVAEDHQLPGAIPTIFADLDQYAKEISLPEPWHTSVNDPDLTSEIIGLLKLLLTPSSVNRFVLLVSRHRTFVPRLLEQREEKGVNAFWHEYRNFSAFWMFENINHYILSDFIPVTAIDPLRAPMKFTVPVEQELREDESDEIWLGPPVRVWLSEDNELNERWIAMLAYLGVPVSTWKANTCRGSLDSSVESEYFEVDISREGASVHNLYSRYLRACLKLGSRIGSIRRAFAGVDGKFSIESIRIEVDRTRDEVVHFIHLHDLETGRNSRIAVAWKPVASARLDLCILNPDSLLAGIETSSTGSFPREEGEVSEPFLASVLFSSTQWYSIASSKEENSAHRKLRSTLQAVHDRTVAVKAVATRGLLPEIGHEIMNTMPAIEDLPRAFKAKSNRVEVRRFRAGVNFLKLLASVWGSVKGEGDLFSMERDITADKGLDWLLATASDRGVALAQWRAARGYNTGSDHEEISDDWFLLMQNVTRASLSRYFNANTREVMFWPPNTEFLARRIGAQLLIVSTVANAVQHTIYALRADLGPILFSNSFGWWRRRRRLEQLQAKARGALTIEVGLRQLLIKNRALRIPDDPPKSTNFSPSLGSIQVLRRILTSELFRWEGHGEILRNEGVDAAGGAEWILDVQLPKGFWRRK